jgi:hypothetical protein
MYVWAEWYPPVNVYFYASLEGYQAAGEKQATITTSYNGVINPLPAPPPAETDYTFKRWVYKDTTETVREFTTAIPVTATMYVWAEWIYAGPPTTGTILTAGQWRTGSIESEVQYYYFLATTGSTYTITWNDYRQGDGTKTGYISVSASWYDTDASIFTDAGSGFTTGRSFTAPRNGYVMVEVARYYPSSSYHGSYAIKYDKINDNTLPVTGTLPAIGAALVAGQWISGTIESEAQYYYICATTGSTYTIKWSDRYEGDGKVGDILVSAYWYDTDVSIFANANSGYTTGRSVTVPRNGYVMLKAVRNSSGYTGSYAIKYE